MHLLLQYSVDVKMQYAFDLSVPPSESDKAAFGKQYFPPVLLGNRHMILRKGLAAAWMNSTVEKNDIGMEVMSTERLGRIFKTITGVLWQIEKLKLLNWKMSAQFY